MEMKKLLESLQECGMNEMPVEGGMPQQDGTPVSMNVSLNASGKDNVEDLISMMKNAGMGGAQEVGQDMMPMRHDIESFRGMVDGPEDSGEEMLGLPPGQEEGMHEQSIAEWSSEDADQLKMLHGLVQSAAYRGVNSRPGAEFEDYIDNNYPHIDSEKLLAKLVRMDDNAQFEALHELITSEYRADSDEDGTDQSMRKGELGMEGYDNEPNDDYQGSNYMLRDLSGGINREKKAYAKAQDGDNAMAVETIKSRLLDLLSEKKAKPDFADIDGDGDKKEPMKKAAKDKKKGNK